METVILILIFIIGFGFICNFVEDTKKSNDNYISFKESIDLTEVPVITFYQGEKKINFLLDTGANRSVINKKDLDNYDYEKTDTTLDVMGMTGKKITNTIVKMNISYKNYDFSEEFQNVDMSKAFDEIKTSTGVTINGILGTKFFQKYKYILDFDKLVAYSNE